MKILYFDCFSGISGDMTVAALVDAGADRKFIENGVRKLLQNEEKLNFHWNRVNKKGVSALDFNFHNHSDFSIHRDYASIKKQIQRAEFDPHIEKTALEIFHHIAFAEGKIHNCAIENVHFHEVGALDSIVDIVATALAIYSLDIDQIAASPIAVGSGFIECQHGRYPVPAMATLELLKEIPVRGGNCPFELTTPTGAGIIRTLATEFLTDLPLMTVDQIGYGAGKRDLPETPNILRIIIGHTTE